MESSLNPVRLRVGVRKVIGKPLLMMRSDVGSVGSDIRDKGCKCVILMNDGGWDSLHVILLLDG